jgi:hypothetical protein
MLEKDKEIGAAPFSHQLETLEIVGMRKHCITKEME